MGYPHRLQVAGGEYHITTRGTGPSRIFRDREDRRRFMRVLEYTIGKYDWRLHMYCLMVTHFHLVLTTPEPNIARGMQLLNSVYARTFNKRHDRVGHLVAARYSAKVIESAEHALEVCRYVPLNPVRSGLCDRPEQWPWSSYAATLGTATAPPFLDFSWVLGQFSSDLQAARQALREHVQAGTVSETVEPA